MKVRVRVQFEVRDGTGAPVRVETVAQKDIEMPFPPQVGLELLVDEDIDITISQVVFDHKKQQFSVWCGYDAESKGEIEESVKRFVRQGWTHNPY